MENLSSYIPPLEKGDREGFFESDSERIPRSLLRGSSFNLSPQNLPLPLFAKEGFRRIPAKRE
jgi:hypothetical protein